MIGHLISDVKIVTKIKDWSQFYRFKDRVIVGE